MSYDFAISAGAGLGFSLGLSFVTDYRGNGGAYFSIGPEVVTNVAAGGGFGLGFWPKVNQGSFVGWGWGLGVSAGPPTKVVSGSVSIFMDEELKDVQGFGFGGRRRGRCLTSRSDLWRVTRLEAVTPGFQAQRRSAPERTTLSGAFLWRYDGRISARGLAVSPKIRYALCYICRFGRHKIRETS